MLNWRNDHYNDELQKIKKEDFDDIAQIPNISCFPLFVSSMSLF